MTEWQPIETAPKDGTEILLFIPRGPVVGKWNIDQYAKKPRPYWTNDQERIFGTRDARVNGPTHWMPLPEHPK